MDNNCRYDYKKCSGDFCNTQCLQKFQEKYFSRKNEVVMINDEEPYRAKKTSDNSGDYRTLEQYDSSNPTFEERQSGKLKPKHKDLDNSSTHPSLKDMNRLLPTFEELQYGMVLSRE